MYCMIPKKRMQPATRLIVLLLAAVSAGMSFGGETKVIDFDADTTGKRPPGWDIWIDPSGGSVEIGSGGYHDTKALRIAGAKAAAAQYKVKASPGEVVALGVSSRQMGAGDRAFKVNYLDKNGAEDFSRGSYEGRFIPGGEAWQQSQIKVLVPEDASGVQVVLSAEHQRSESDVVWFDQMSVTREGQQPLAKKMPNDPAPKVEVQLTEEDYKLPSSNREALNMFRMNILKHNEIVGVEISKWVTPETATEYAKKVRKAGYNIVLTEGQRYLMSDTRDHDTYPDVLQGSLPFPELVKNTKAIADACHSEGLRVYLHLTAALTSKEGLRDHPDRMAVSVNDGKPRTVWGLEWMCLNNPELQKEYFSRLERLMKETRVDGLMVDETTMMGENCGCRYCRTKFAEDTKLQMPPPGTPWFGDLSNDVYRAFLQWRLKIGLEYNDHIRAIVRKYNPEGELLGYYAVPYHPSAWRDHGYSLEASGATSRPLGLEMISNYWKFWPLFIANMKFVRAVSEHKDGDVFAIANPPSYEGIYQHWLMSISQGAHQYWTSYVPESLWQARTPLLQWEMKNQSLLAGLRSAARTAVVISTRNNNLHRAPLGSIKLQNSYLAIANTLTMGQVPFKALGDLDLDQPLTGKVQTIVALNLSLLSTAQAENLRKFVRDGGTLITSLDFSLYDTEGAALKNFSLADIMGCDYVSTKRQDGILAIEKADAIAGDVTGEFAIQDSIVEVKPHEGAEVTGMIKLGDGATVPGLIRNKSGQGQVFYFAGHIEPMLSFTQLNGTQIQRRSYGDDRDEKFEKLFLSLLRNTAEEAVEVSNLPHGVVLETYNHDFKGAKAFVVSLLNFTGMLSDGQPEMAQLRYPDIKAQLPNPQAPIRISWRGQASKAFAISPDFIGRKELPLMRDKDAVSVDLPSFGNLEMVYFEK